MNISGQLETLCLIYLHMLHLGKMNQASRKIYNPDNYMDSNNVAFFPSIFLHEKLRVHLGVLVAG